MHIRRLACCLLGVWFGVSFFMWFVATHNLKSVDSLLAKPAPTAQEQINKLGRDAARSFVRYHAAELNRFYFQSWERIQIGLGILLLLVLFFGTLGDRGVLLLCLLMIAAVLVERFVLTPEMTQLGRAIDFLGPDEPSAERTSFWMRHWAYSGVEFVKLALGAILTGKLLMRHRRHSSHALQEVDMIDEADNGHVDR